MESQFRLAGINAEIKKLHHVVSALQPEELAIVSDLVLKPLAEKQSSALWARLCSQYAASEEQRLRDHISGMQLRDRKLSSLLLEMRSKAENRITDDLLKSLFLQHLPNIQQILAIPDNRVEKLAEMADINDTV